MPGMLSEKTGSTLPSLPSSAGMPGEYGLRGGSTAPFAVCLPLVVYRIQQFLEQGVIPAFEGEMQPWQIGKQGFRVMIVMRQLH